MARCQFIWRAQRGDTIFFSPVLMPIRIATLTEVDGDVRLALVNDQTGEVVFGETYRGRAAERFLYNISVPFTFFRCKRRISIGR